MSAGTTNFGAPGAPKKSKMVKGPSPNFHVKGGPASVAKGPSTSFGPKVVQVRSATAGKC